MKKNLLFLSLFSLILTSCELTIGDNVNCSCTCCGEGQSCGQTEQTTNEVFKTDEYNIEEDTTLTH